MAKFSFDFPPKPTPGTPLDRRGPPCTSTCTKNQPRRPILRPLRGEQKVPPDCLQAPRQRKNTKPTSAKNGPRDAKSRSKRTENNPRAVFWVGLRAAGLRWARQAIVLHFGWRFSLVACGRPRPWATCASTQDGPGADGKRAACKPKANWVPEGSLAGNFWPSFPLIFRRSRPPGPP